MSNNLPFPPWLGGRLPQGLSTESQKPSGVRKITQGRQRVIKTKEELAGSKYFNGLSIARLDFALVGRAIELQDLHQARRMPDDLAALIRNFVALIVKSNDATTKHKGKNPPRTLENARQLLVPLEKFKDRVAELVPVSEWGLLLCMVLDELAADIEHFITQITWNSAIVMVTDGKPRIRNRPSNQVVMAAYASIISEYQAVHGPEEFLKPALIQRQLKAQGHPISDRTLRDWKSHIKRGTLGDYIQVRKRQ